MPNAPATLTTLDGSVISATITGLTAHSWTADTTGTYQTATNLQAEWQANYALMLAGHGDQLTALQRMEGNAEATFENTKANKLSQTLQGLFRADAQREFDAIYAAMQINQTLYGIDPTKQFNTYTYLKLEQTLQQNEQLNELAIQGHGLNSPPAARYDGYVASFQYMVDNSTFYVGGGLDNGNGAISSFFADTILTNAPFATVMHNGVLQQLTWNGNLGNPLSTVIAAANASAFTRVFVASDFSTTATAVGAVQLVPNAQPAPPLPTPPASNPNLPPTTITTFDGSIISATISGLTAHQWTADATGLFTTWSDLATEWKAAYATMLAGNANQLTPLQRLEGNAEAVLENTGAKNLAFAVATAFRQDAQREFDAIDAAMRIDQVQFGIDPAAQFNAYTYQRMEETLQQNETLKELGYQGHGVNNPTVTRYDGFTTDFQNRIDGTTYYVGGGPGTGELAIASFFDDDVLTHACFPAVMNNGVMEQLNQNGNLEDPLSDAITAANNAMFTRVLVASDFSTTKTAVGAVVTVPNPAPASTTPPPGVSGIDQILQPAYYLAAHPQVAADGLDPVSHYDSVGWKAGFDPSPWFDTNYYLAQNPDVKAAGVDPLLHFETYGWKEGRDPSLMFSDSKYLAAYTDVARAGVDPLLHFQQNGQAEGRMTFLTGGTEAADPLVDPAFYDKQLGATLIPTGAAAQQQAAWSYDTTGWQRGLNPDAWFDTQYYLSHNPDVAAAGINPLQHYELFGWKEGRNPSAQFDGNKYLAANPDVNGVGVNPLLHYVLYGQAEGRSIYSV